MNDNNAIFKMSISPDSEAFSKCDASVLLEAPDLAHLRRVILLNEPFNPASLEHVFGTFIINYKT